MRLADLAIIVILDNYYKTFVFVIKQEKDFWISTQYELNSNLVKNSKFLIILLSLICLYIHSHIMFIMNVQDVDLIIA